MKYVSFEPVFDLLRCYFSVKNVEFEQIADAAVEQPRTQKQVAIKNKISCMLCRLWALKFMFGCSKQMRKSGSCCRKTIHSTFREHAENIAGTKIKPVKSLFADFS
jgi:hypothetical protein